MKMRIYVVMDETAKESGPIYEAKNDGVALRNFKNLMSKTQDPSEFILLYLGEIDHEKNEIQVVVDPETVNVTLETEVEE